MKIERVWAMPSADTFDVLPIARIVKERLAQSSVSVDPFARNKDWATYTNDLNPQTKAQSHLDAIEFLESLSDGGIKADLFIFDPPYSPRQIAECYQQIGRTVTMQDTQSSFWKKVRDAAIPILTDDAIVISCGWNSSGMGRKRGFELLEILIVCHGGAHNDTIVTVEKRLPRNLELFK